MKGAKAKDALDYEHIFMCAHESAHTIVALHNFLQVFNVNTIRIGAKTRAEKSGSTDWYSTIYTGIDSELKRILLICELQAMYAGLLGERILYKYLTGSPKLPMNLRVGLSYDIKKASGIIRNNNLAESGKDTANLKNNIQKKTEKILLDHWEEVRIIAHILHKKRQLDFDELKQLLTKKTKQKDFWKDRFSKIERIYIYEGNKHPSEDVIKKILLNK
jgi:hypothetical protein